ncbi:MAG: hypothetical protein P4L16_03355 [Chlamydiales bacterium]|nr:hypothetical protein [Chlamydiales bacterium]
MMKRVTKVPKNKKTAGKSKKTALSNKRLKKASGGDISFRVPESIAGVSGYISGSTASRSVTLGTNLNQPGNDLENVILDFENL